MSRPLTWFDRWVKAPLGIVYLGFLLVVAVPVLIWMTLLYWMVEAFRSLRTRSRRGGSREMTNRAA